MRQRKPKNLQEKLAAHGDYLVARPEEARGRWRSLFRSADGAGLGACGAGGLGGDGGAASPSAGAGCGETGGHVFSSRKLFLEIGSGKGAFLTRKAQNDPESLYLGFEGREAVVLRAAEKAGAAGLKNILFSNLYVRDLAPVFAPGEADGLFLNFSDPWPKARHSGRRLTCGQYLAMYARLLKSGSRIEFKTDSNNFFRFSKEVLEESPEFEIVEAIEGVYDACDANSLILSGLALSEYEERFIRWNRRIYFLSAAKIGNSFDI
ncbi:MAG: tRNA (guanosine(46)-N7)-methyltransferase TrmB [Clostridiales Family XIII bacterium]|jgi:tRNA (guanine-N7-)-methyltransferase|nr:tRNA (guanosine(46)-N7)-methyltransferase TrmB [Clostridiales Family XIII bacterium]